MSLQDPCIPKHACQIHVSWSASASRMIVHPSHDPWIVHAMLLGSYSISNACNPQTRAYLETLELCSSPKASECLEHWVLSSTMDQTLYHSYCILLDIEDRSALCHRQVVINVICRNTICHHAQSGSDLLLNAMAKQPGTLPSLLEDWIMLLHGIANAKEQVFRHSETASKVILRKNKWWCKVVAHQPFVRINPFSPNERTTINGTTVLRFLPPVHGH